MPHDESDNGVTERRRGLHELAEQIRCIREDFQAARVLIENRVTAIEVWRAKTDPVMQTIVKAMWMVAGASVVLMSATAVVVWVWLQDHKLLSDVTRLSLSQSALIEQMQKDDARMERDIDALRSRREH